MRTPLRLLLALVLVTVSVSATAASVNPFKSKSFSTLRFRSLVLKQVGEKKITMVKAGQTATLKTTLGDIVIELNVPAAPKTVTSFVYLAKAGFYDGLTFHRVIPDFMIQAGDPLGNGRGGQSIYGKTFKDEKNNFLMTRGVIAMANRGPNTNGSQFFILQADAPWLQGSHTIFGKVVKGMDVVDAIATTPRDSQNDAPLTPVTFTAVVGK